MSRSINRSRDFSKSKRSIRNQVQETEKKKSIGVRWVDDGNYYIATRHCHTQMWRIDGDKWCSEHAVLLQHPNILLFSTNCRGCWFSFATERISTSHITLSRRGVAPLFSAFLVRPKTHHFRLVCVVFGQDAPPRCVLSLCSIGNVKVVCADYTVTIQW